MNSLLVMVVTFVLYILAYNRYGKRLGSKVFEPAAKNITPIEKCKGSINLTAVSALQYNYA